MTSRPDPAALKATEAASTELAEYAWRFRQLTDVITLQAWTMGPAGRFTFLNTECRRYLGVVAGAAIDQGWFAALHPGDAERVRTSLAKALATETSFEAEIQLRNEGGSYRWFLVRAEALYLRDGRLDRWFGTNTDIDTLKQEQERLRQSSQAKDIFLAKLSHELRTPLTPALMTAAALAEDSRLPAEVRGQMEMLRQNIAIETRLIDDLLDFSGIAHGRLKLQISPCDLHELIDRAIAIVEGEARTKGCTIQPCYGAARCGAEADPARIQQVIWNLLYNAIKFTPAGGVIRIITRDISADGAAPDRIQIEIADSGIGIAPEALEKIFLPFEQAAAQPDRRKTGLGLGLAIARAIIGQHGGKIVARSDGPRHGASFLIELPALPPPARVKEVPDATVSTATVAGRRILLVEDHAPTLRVLRDLLSQDGHHVTTAACLSDAFLAAHTTKFDLLISDLGLPDGSGNELMTTLGRTGGLKGIALTGYGMESDKAESSAAGFRWHLTKPINASLLRQAIGEAMR